MNGGIDVEPIPARVLGRDEDIAPLEAAVVQGCARLLFVPVCLGGVCPTRVSKSPNSAEKYVRTNMIETGLESLVDTIYRVLAVTQRPCPEGNAWDLVS